MNDSSAEVDSTRKTPNSDHFKEPDDVFEDLEADAQELRTISRQVAASVVADSADSNDYREKSNAASDGGTSGCGSQSLAPPTSGIGLDLSGSDEWMML